MGCTGLARRTCLGGTGIVAFVGHPVGVASRGFWHLFDHHNRGQSKLQCQRFDWGQALVSKRWIGHQGKDCASNKEFREHSSHPSYAFHVCYTDDGASSVAKAEIF